LEAKDPDPQQALLDRQSQQQVRRAMSKLEDRARLAIALRYYADLSYEEIAETLGVNSSFVGVLLLRARRKLRQLLTEEVTS
jgi:RNA polymerase sigma-70 factor (ECF subfamily)